jgi:hypothetical protein
MCQIQKQHTNVSQMAQQSMTFNSPCKRRLEVTMQNGSGISVVESWNKGSELVTERTQLQQNS